MAPLSPFAGALFDPSNTFAVRVAFVTGGVSQSPAATVLLDRQALRWTDRRNCRLD
jgi:hypothetical protein